MAKPKFDYDSKEFYTAIGNLAAKDYDDREIALHIGEEIRAIIAKQDNDLKNAAIDAGLPLPAPRNTSHVPESLTPEVFCRMKNGNYERWNERENKLRSMLIAQVLERARVNLCLLYKGVYDRAALGKLTTKSTTTVTKETLSRDGLPLTEVTTSQTTTELPPNMQALTVWRYHHDPEFRENLARMKRMEVEVENKGVESIKVNVVYNKKEDVELQTRKE